MIAVLFALAVADATITLDRPAELTAVVSAQCVECAWDVAGREAITFTISLDGAYAQHLPLVRTGDADYAIALGRVAAGTHAVSVEVDPATTAAALRAPGIASARVTLKPIDERAPNFLPLALAPMLYARANTVGRFTDAPVLMWYEVEPGQRSTRYRYSVIFTNEDGGTPTDRLLATWGRTTDIEYVYGVEVDPDGRILSEEYQGPEHRILPFKGRREGRHPMLWVATDNNMVSDTGETSIRYAPQPIPFDLSDTSREAVMDANPWTYAVAGKEMVREQSVDTRRFLYVEACAEVGSAAIAFGARVNETWFTSDGGRADHRIGRDGCVRGAIPLPQGVDGREVNAVRVSAYARPSRNGEPAPPPSAVRLTRINTAFVLSPQYAPMRSLVHWTGLETIAVGSHFELPVLVPRPVE